MRTDRGPFGDGRPGWYVWPFGLGLFWLFGVDEFHYADGWLDYAQAVGAVFLGAAMLWDAVRRERRWHRGSH